MYENKLSDDEMTTPEDRDEGDITVEKTNKLVLKDLPAEAHKDYIQLFFEGKRMGNHEVINVEVDTDLAMALVEFSMSEGTINSICKILDVYIDLQLYRFVPSFSLFPCI